jgi:putative cell wall-binding protein
MALMLAFGMVPASAFAAGGSQTGGHEAATSILNSSQALDTPYALTVPTGADVKVFKQLNNYNLELQAPYSSEDKGDGTKVYQYISPATSGAWTYRVSLPGKITKAGYIGSEPGTTVTFGENEDPGDTTNTALPARNEGSTFTNVPNGENHLRLAPGDTFRLRGYRAAWQIINSDVGNQMIEPDFHFTVLSGTDVISIAPHAVIPNWADITARAAGTAVVEVSYDAIDVAGSNAGRYGATDPQRKAVFVVTVAPSQDDSITISVPKPYNNDIWDSEFDTWYLLGESTQAAVTVNTPGATLTAWNPAYANSEQALTEQGGSYGLTLYPGNNIVKAEKDGTVSYKVIRAAVVRPIITNVTTPGVSPQPGDTVTLHLDGLFMPVPKMSGIYNPGYGGTAKVRYLAGGTEVTSTGRQYDLITANETTIVIPNDAEVGWALTGGYVACGHMGSTLGSHRNITNTGPGANTLAPALSGVFGVLPNITVVKPKTIYLSVEKFTLGQGYVREPIAVEVEPGENAANLVDKVLGQDNYKNTGDLALQFYLSSIKDDDPGTLNVPQYLLDALKADGVVLGTRLQPGWLAERDYTNTSGWMLAVNNESAPVGMSEYTYSDFRDGDVMRVQFSLYGYGADIGWDTSVWGGDEPYYAVANRDALTTEIARINGRGDKAAWLAANSNKAKYDNALAVLTDLASTQEAVDAALATLTDANPLPDLDPERIAGTDRYLTMQKVVQAAYPSHVGVSTVILARGDDFPDALAASALAGVKDAPIVLTSSTAFTDVAQTEIRRLAPSEVIIVGGYSAVAQATEEALGSSAFPTVTAVTRLAGSDRYDTARMIFAQVSRSQRNTTTAIVANGANFADALSISPYAFTVKAPIFLASPSYGLAQETIAAIRAAGFTRVIILGGIDALPATVESQLSGITVKRIAGAHRYETSQKAAQFSLDEGIGLISDGVLVAKGQDFPDALVGSVLAGRRHTVLLLADEVYPASSYGVDTFITQHKEAIHQVCLLGGASALSDALAARIKAAHT